MNEKQKQMLSDAGRRALNAIIRNPLLNELKISYEARYRNSDRAVYMLYFPFNLLPSGMNKESAKRFAKRKVICFTRPD